MNTSTYTYVHSSELVADARAVQGPLELVLALAGVSELEEADQVILLLPCILLSLVRCILALALCLFVLFFVMLLATCAFRAGSRRLPEGNCGGV